MKFIALIFALAFAQFSTAGDSGCGLGSVVISKNSKGLQILSMTTNGTFSSQMFGITSGTSNCSASGLVKNEKEIQYFVEVNQADLSREMAQGQGEKLNTLATLHGCLTREGQTAFSQMTKTSFAQIQPSAQTTASEVVNNLNNQVQTNSEVKQLCSVASL